MALLRVYSFEGMIPVVAVSSYVHPSAVLIGDVHVAEECFIGPGCYLRGDMGRLVVGRGSNLQDGCIMHGYPGTVTVVEEECHVGHGATLHGCTLKRGAFIGMRSIIMDDAVVGESAMVGAGSLVRSGIYVKPGSLVTGTPARLVRMLTADEIARNADGPKVYQELTRRYLKDLLDVEPITTDAEAGP